MKWNWQLSSWPNFVHQANILKPLEEAFLVQSGVLLGICKDLTESEKLAVSVELITDEALKTSEIEGEHLNRDHIQAYIGRHFGLTTDHRRVEPAEYGISEMMLDLYRNFSAPLSDELLKEWHQFLMNGRRDLIMIGGYRAHETPLQIVSQVKGQYKIHYEAPPASIVPKEMTHFIQWFNATAPTGTHALPALTRAGIAHLYFECIHPFEDGNGRIGRAIAAKSLAQCLGQPSLIALSHTIQKNRKSYYENIGLTNTTTEITSWPLYFVKTILEAQEYTQDSFDFIIEKTKLYDRLRDKINTRQEKVIARMFMEGLSEFKGGLSTENYISITKISRSTATRDLQDLVEKGALLKTGILKSTRYFLNGPTKNKK